MWPVCPTFAIMKIIAFFCTHVYVYSFLSHIREFFFQNCRDMNGSRATWNKLRICSPMFALFLQINVFPFQ